MAFTTMDAAKPVRASVNPQIAEVTSPSSNVDEPSVASQVPRGDKLEIGLLVSNHEDILFTDLCM